MLSQPKARPQKGTQAAWTFSLQRAWEGVVSARPQTSLINDHFSSKQYSSETRLGSHLLVSSLVLLRMWNTVGPQKAGVWGGIQNEWIPVPVSTSHSANGAPILSMLYPGFLRKVSTLWNLRSAPPSSEFESHSLFSTVSFYNPNPIDKVNS